MTEQDAIDMIKAGAYSGDIEVNHCTADEIIIQFIRELGYDKLADAWGKVEKWYA